METLQLTKHQALGNSFLIALVSNAELSHVDAMLQCRGMSRSDLARNVCARSVVPSANPDADGLIFGISDDLQSLRSNPTESIRMVLYNSDGSSAEISGNGLACLGHAVTRHLDLAYTEFWVATDAGRQYVQSNQDGPGAPIVALVDYLPPVGPGPGVSEDLAEQVISDFGDVRFATGDIGNPHLVIESTRPLDADETSTLGSKYETHFAAGINVEFIWTMVGKPNHLGMSVWERGAGLTGACGSGAVVAATQASQWRLVTPGRPLRQVVVVMPGGTATVFLGSDQPIEVGVGDVAGNRGVDVDDDHYLPSISVETEFVNETHYPLHVASQL